MHEPLEITLNRKEVVAAVEIGVQRHIETVASKLVERSQPFIQSWDDAINEALSEAAVYKWLNGRNTVKARPAMKGYGNLVISDKDAETDLIALVSCLTPVFKIEGFIRVSDAQAMKDCQAQTEAGRRWWINKSQLRDPREMGGR